MTYIFTYFLVLLNSIFNLINNFPKKTVYYFLAFILTYIIAFRYASVDYFGYLRIYEAIKIDDLSNFGLFTYDIDISTPIETGFALFIVLEKLIVGDFFVFIALFAFVSLFIKFQAFKKMSPYIILSLLIYMSNEYFWKDLGQIRNGFASGIILWALYFAYQKKFTKFVLLILFASMFHSSAIVALPFYFVQYIRSRIFLSFSIILAFLIVIIFGGIGSLLVEISSSVFGFEDSSRLVKYADGKYSTGASVFGGTIMLQTFISFIFIAIYKKHQRVFPLATYFTPVFVLTTSLFIVFNDYAIIGSRINDMIVLPVGCVLIPSVLLLFRGVSKILVFISILAYSILWFYMMFTKTEDYQSVFQFLF